ncbi:ferritin-like domain-containing protein [Hymenobacter terrenus]|uniref:ferritin-like domain-containing protein n=1 Tax=Hymenobacter terrenus TaxID=1629124 RepID=UPI000619CBA7|nr:ferritin-like domain-containing protein [Hymenobacter terrenus]
MNFFEIIDQLSEVDGDVLGRFNSRRAVFGTLGGAAKRSALAATPLFLSALFQKAYAGTKSLPVEVLQYALTLELLEQDFYVKVIGSAPYAAASPADREAIQQIKRHEDAHVKLLGTAISGLGSSPVTGVRFQQGKFDSLTSFNGSVATTSQLAVAQLLEDTGVRAYKGRAAELVGTDLLTTALRIHSVEARHAAHIRFMRGQKPWVNPADDLAADAVYGSGVTAGTSPTTITPFGYGVPAFTVASPIENSPAPRQAGVAIRSITSGVTYPLATAAAAFDEVLQPAEVLDASRAGGLVGA